MSIAPISVPVSGSCTGAAAHVHAVDGAHEVLGGVDLDRLVDGECRAHRVRPDGVLRPAHARREPDRVGRAEQAAGTFAPQDRPVRVGHDHDVHGLVRDAHQRAAQQREDGAERVRGPDPVDVGGLVDDGRVVAVGVDVGGEAAPPRVGDERARDGAGGRAGEHGVVDLVQRTRPLDRVAREGRTVAQHSRALVRHEHLEHRRCCTVRLPIITSVAAGGNNTVPRAT